MNDLHLESLLVAAAKRHSDDSHIFVNNTMEKIMAIPPKESKKNWLGVLFRQHRLIYAALAIAVISVVGFSGYAYAIGSDPVSLIKRWVEGDKVKIEYQSRQFEHGKAHNYSDAAVTAYAELNTVDGIAFAAMNAGAIPKNGVEYLGPPYGSQIEHVYPIIGTIQQVTDSTIVIHQDYMLGDKMSPSHANPATITIPNNAEFQHFKEAKRTKLGAADVGTLVELRQDSALKHTIGSKEMPQIVKQYFSFALQHTLAEFKEADQANTKPENKNSEATTGLIEQNFGGLNDLCLNNGADACNPKYYSNEGQSLYGNNHKGNTWFDITNPRAIAFGEGVAPGRSQPQNLILRGIYGTITDMSSDTITIKSSSGSHWTVAFNASQREAFKSYWSPELKIGDKIAGSVLQSTASLDDRSVADQYVCSLMRMQ